MTDPLPVNTATTTTTLAGRTAFVSLLASEGVALMFGNPGTTELAIMQALTEQSQIGYVLGLQESIVVGMADGYARASGRLAACNVHVAPGLGNALGALYNAKFFGSPVLVTAGQQEQGFGLTEPMLYDALVPMAAPYVKWAIEVTRVQDLPRIIRRAAKVALTPPTGPVFLSLPGDILDASAELELGAPTRVAAANRPNDDLIAQLAAALQGAQRPVIIAGHELATREAFGEASELANLLGIPVYQQTVPTGAHFPSEHPAYMGWISRSQPQVRAVLEQHDLLLLLGAEQLRMAVSNRIEALPNGLRIVQISERDWELGKNYPTELAVLANVRETLRALNATLTRAQTATTREVAAQRLRALAADNWTARRRRAIDDGVQLASVRPFDPRFLMMRLVECLPRDVVVVDEGLTSTASLLNFLPYRDSQGYYGLASGGIGFAIAGAIGISLALRPRPVVAIIGDGSAMYSIQALWTAANMKLPIVYVIANNRGYRIIKERMKSMRGSEHFLGMDFRDPEIDFVALAESMGVPALRLTEAEQIGPAMATALGRAGPTLLEVMVADGFGGPPR